jgi:hypothetical protein
MVDPGNFSLCLTDVAIFTVSRVSLPTKLKIEKIGDGAPAPTNESLFSMRCRPHRTNSSIRKTARLIGYSYT